MGTDADPSAGASRRVQAADLITPSIDQTRLAEASGFPLTVAVCVAEYGALWTKIDRDPDLTGSSFSFTGYTHIIARL